MSAAAKKSAFTITGFEGIQKFYDSALQKHVAKISPGEYYVTNQDEVISTVLGSCISACVRDTKIGIGGMNHFMVPAKCEFSSPQGHELITRYGTYAMEHLINDVYKYGGNRKTVEIKLFGAGSVIAVGGDVGKKNILFVKEFMQTEGYKIAAEDLGGNHPRKVLYSPLTGKVKVKRIRSTHKQAIAKQEIELQKQMDQTETVGEIDLF